MKMDHEEKLIYLVQRHECLYNINSKYYSDKNSKNNAWQKVCAEMNMSAEDCQRSWKKIRDSYRKGLSLRDNRSGSARKTERPLKFEKELEFLKPFIQGRKQISNLMTSPEESESTTDCEFHSIQSPVPEPQLSPAPGSDSQLSVSPQPQSQLLPLPRPQSKEQPLKMSNLLLKQYIENKRIEDDPTISFFLTMGRTVRTMPKNIQAKLKGAIFRLVNEAEIRLADESDSMSYSEHNRPNTAESSIFATRNCNETTMPSSRKYRLETTSIEPSTSEIENYNETNIPTTSLSYTPSKIPAISRGSQETTADTTELNISSTGNRQTTMPSFSNDRLAATRIKPSTSVSKNYIDNNIPTTSFSYTPSITPAISRNFQETNAVNNYDTNCLLPTYTKLTSSSNSFIDSPPSPYVPYPISKSQKKYSDTALPEYEANEGNTNAEFDY